MNGAQTDDYYRKKCKLMVSTTMTTTVILFGGLPASGKSSLSKKIKESMGSDKRKVIHLEYDLLEDEISSQQEEKDGRLAWNQARHTAVQNLDTILEKSQQDVETSLLILLDDNFHLRGMRKQIHRRLLSLKQEYFRRINFGIIWMDTDLDTCLQRNVQRQRQIDENVIRKMNLSMETPRSAWEGCWIHGTTSLVNVIDFVNNCEEIIDLEEDIVDQEQQERDRQTTLDNLRHSSDKLLRSWVGKVAKHDKRLAGSANGARKELLLLLKDDSYSEIASQEQLLESFLDLIFSSTILTGQSSVETNENLRDLLQAELS